MRRETNDQQVIAKALPHAEVEKLLMEIGKLIKTMRDDRTTLERFSYEVKISRSQMSKYEAGGDMLLSTFLKVLHGLDTTGEGFFKELRK